MNLIDTIKRFNPSLKKAEIAGILYLIREGDGLENNELIRLTGIPKEELRRFKSTISNLLEDVDKEVVVLSPEGKKLLNELKLVPYSWNLFSYENEELEKKLIDLRNKFNLEPKREYDQWFATEKTSVNKVEIMKSKDCVVGKRIMLLGDDDLVSSTLGLTKLEYADITVLDIDKDILSTIDSIAKCEGFKNIGVDYYDARKEMPSKYIGQYDCVITDPPYTKAGIGLFLNRAVEFLGGKDKYIFLYYGNSFKSLEKTVKIQEIISRMGLVIEDKIDKFARYYGAESIGSASSVYVLRTTEHTHTLRDLSVIENIYTFENQGEEKFPFVDHVTIKINNIPNNIVKSKSGLSGSFGRFCDIHKLKVVDTKITKFSGGGMTFTYVLANSNLVVHTWPEHGALHIDLITCSPIYKKEEISGTIKKLFKTNSIEVRYIE